MDKNEKIALKTGVDRNDNPLHYICQRCGWEVSLMHKRCPKCGNKRPKDAYKMALYLQQEEYRATKKTATAYAPDRSVRVIPLPKETRYVGTEIEDVVRSAYPTEMHKIMGIPKYFSTDEYGRVYEAPVCYKPVHGGGPVPVAAPSKVVQTDAVNVPINVQR